MGINDINAVLENHRRHKITVMQNISRSKANSIKRGVDKLINQDDKFCEMTYNNDTCTARFDIVS